MRAIVSVTSASPEEMSSGSTDGQQQSRSPGSGSNWYTRYSKGLIWQLMEIYPALIIINSSADAKSSQEAGKLPGAGGGPAAEADDGGKANANKSLMNDYRQSEEMVILFACIVALIRFLEGVSWGYSPMLMHQKQGKEGTMSIKLLMN